MVRWGYLLGIWGEHGDLRRSSDELESDDITLSRCLGLGVWDWCGCADAAHRAATLDGISGIEGCDPLATGIGICGTNVDWDWLLCLCS